MKESFAPGHCCTVTAFTLVKRNAGLFLQHLEVAAELGLNCVIHQRDSLEDTLAQFQPFADRVRAVFHCFADDAAAMQRIVAMGSLVSFTGILTFKNGQTHSRHAGGHAARPVHVGDGLPVPRSHALSRQALRAGLCERDGRGRRPGQGLFARGTERSHLRDVGAVLRGTPFSLTALRAFGNIAPVMGVSHLAGTMNSGAGWPPKWGYRAPQVFQADFVFVRTGPDA